MQPENTQSSDIFRDLESFSVLIGCSKFRHLDETLTTVKGTTSDDIRDTNSGKLIISMCYYANV